jgi:hypothetical protein
MSTKKTALPYLVKAPSGALIIWIIVLGIGGMFGTFKYLIHDLKMTGYQKQVWLVRNRSTEAISHQITPVDTLNIVYQPQIGAHLAEQKKLAERAVKNKTVLKRSMIDGDIDYEDIYFSYNSVLLVWIAFFSLMVGCSLAAALVVVIALKQIVLTFKLKPKSIIRVFILTSLIGTAMYFSGKTSYSMGMIPLITAFNIISKNPDVLRYMVGIAIAVALLTIAGQLLINEAISELDDIAVATSAEQNDIAGKFLLLKNQIRFFLLISAVLIVFSVLTTDAFRRAVSTEISANIDLFPQNYVYLYGAMFTFYLAIIYIPVYYRLKNRGELLLKALPKEKPGDDDSIVSIFDLKESPMDNLKVALSILAPLLSSLVPGLLKL